MKSIVKRGRGLSCVSVCFLERERVMLGRLSAVPMQPVRHALPKLFTFPNPRDVFLVVVLLFPLLPQILSMLFCWYLLCYTICDLFQTPDTFLFFCHTHCFLFKPCAIVIIWNFCLIKEIFDLEK